MDFGKRIGKFSETKESERKMKLMKLKKGEELLRVAICNHRIRIIYNIKVDQRI